MNIRVDLNTNIADGSEVVFRSPADCSQVTGLVIYHTGGKTEFAFADAHGNNVGDIDHLFAENAVVKVILDVTKSMAFVQNADTNAYIERTFVKTVNGQAPDEKGNVEVKTPEGGNSSPGNDGKDGGYYVPTVEQVNETEVEISFTSQGGENMPQVDPVKLTLPRGADGKKGDKGDKGDQGEQGPKGDTGATGPQGEAGAKGDQGVPGEKGDPGIPGNDGAPGADGKDGHTPVAGVDYYTPTDKAEFEAYIATELAKRGQLKPEFANSVEECTDTTKLYVLPDGMIYAYMPYSNSVEGGQPLFTNQANPASSDWLTDNRFSSSSGSNSSCTGAVVSNAISAKTGDVIRIKGLKDGTGATSSAYFSLMAYTDTTGTTKAIPSPMLFTKTLSQSAAGVSHLIQTENGITTYELFVSGADGIQRNGSESAVSVRVSGIPITATSDIIVTINEEIAYSEGSTEQGYRWQSTGHAFVPADYEDRIIALESAKDDILAQMESDKEETESALEELQSKLDGASAKSGARWFALGDSITEGWTSAVDSSAESGYRQFINTNTAQRWVNIVAEKNGYNLTNYGVGGSGYVQATNNARAQVAGIDFAGCDFVTLAYGVNDWKYSANVGTAAEIPQTIASQYDGHNALKLSDDSPDTITVYKNGVLLAETTDYTVSGGYIYLTTDSAKGDVFEVYNAVQSMVSNMSYVIKKILRDNPLCKIFVITPINCKSLGTYLTNWGINYSGDASNGIGLDQIFELQKAVCDYHGIELIDMTHSSIVNRENIRSLLADSVHPTVEGHKLMARELSAKINFK